MSIGLRPWRRRGAASRPGGRTTTRSGRIARWAISHRKRSPNTSWRYTPQPPKNSTCQWPNEWGKVRQYQVFIVWDLSRFSRQHPSKVNALLDTIVHRDACRFISKQEGIDSDNELVWNCIKPLFSYFAFTFSRQLSERIRLGIRTKKEKGQYKGGRPAKQIDAERLKTIWRMYPQLGWRLKTARFNEGLDSKHQVSVSLLRKVCKKLSFGSDNGHETHVHEGA